MRVRMWLIILFVACMPYAALGQEMVDAQWVAPTTNTDLTLLTDLAGFRLYWDLVSIPDDKGTAQLAVEVTAGTVTATVSVVVPPPGSIVYFRVLAFDNDGNESILSNEDSIDFLPPSEPLLLQILQAVAQALQEVLESQ